MRKVNDQMIQRHVDRMNEEIITLELKVGVSQVKYLLAFYSVLRSDKSLAYDDLPNILCLIRDELTLMDEKDFNEFNWTEDQRRMISDFLELAD